MFENVKGLWKTAKHRAFYDELKELLSNAGYIMINRLTNSLEFGAPQDRDRILLFGINKRTLNLSTDEPFFNFNWNKYMKYSLDYVKQVKWPKNEPFIENSKKNAPIICQKI